MEEQGLWTLFCRTGLPEAYLMLCAERRRGQIGPSAEDGALQQGQSRGTEVTYAYHNESTGAAQHRL